jgi:hypothetical protein
MLDMKDPNACLGQVLFLEWKADATGVGWDLPRKWPCQTDCNVEAVLTDDGRSSWDLRRGGFVSKISCTHFKSMVVFSNCIALHFR